MSLSLVGDSDGVTVSSVGGVSEDTMGASPLMGRGGGIVTALRNRGDIVILASIGDDGVTVSSSGGVAENIIGVYSVWSSGDIVIPVSIGSGDSVTVSSSPDGVPENNTEASSL